jgi:hypothetical protein
MHYPFSARGYLLYLKKTSIYFNEEGLGILLSETVSGDILI